MQHLVKLLLGALVLIAIVFAVITFASDDSASPVTTTAPSPTQLIVPGGAER